MIEIKKLTTKDLADFIQSNDYKALVQKPITKHRAYSYLCNPRGKEEDIILLLAYSRGILVGYRGILPDKIFYSDGESEDIGWFSTLWVNPSHRGNGIGKQLVNEAFKLWDGKIIATYLSKYSYGLHTKTGLFEETHIKPGIKIHFFLDLTSFFSRRYAGAEILKPALRCIDYLANTLFIFIAPKFSRPNYECLDYVDAEAAAFIKNNQDLELFKRTDKELNWIINNKWVLNSDKPDSEYSFSSFAKTFTYHCIKVKNVENSIIGILIMSRRNNSLKLLYSYHSKESTKDIINVINYHIISCKVSDFTTYNNDYVAFYKKSSLGFYKKNLYRPYLFSKYFSDKLKDKEYIFQEGDGDYVFT